MLSTLRQTHKQIKSININNETEFNHDMAQTFHNFFVTIACDIDNKIIHTNTNYEDFLQDSVLKPVISVNNEVKTNKLIDPKAYQHNTKNKQSDNLQTSNLLN